MPHKKHSGEQGCNCQYHNQKIFNPNKNRWVNIYLSVLFMFNCLSFSSLFVSSLSSVTYQMLFIILPVVSYPQSFISSVISNMFLFLFLFTLFYLIITLSRILRVVYFLFFNVTQQIRFCSSYSISGDKKTLR